jgi:integrase
VVEQRILRKKELKYTRSIGEILRFGLWMEKEGYRTATTRCAVEALRSLSRRVDLFDTDAVKTHLAKAKVSEGRKERVSNDLTRFYRFKGIPFEKPRYRKIEKLPFIPLESEVEQLISAMGQKTGTFLQLLRETGIRCGEAWNLRWVDLDSERGTVNVAPEKNSKPRQLKISSRLNAMLNRLPKKPVYLFREANQDPITSLHGARRNFERQRKRLAVKLQNPRLMQIHFHSLRHFKATPEYHKTKDILYVMQLLGHKNIQNTLVYTHLVNWESDEIVCKVAKTVNEAQALIESGFDYG